MWYELAKGHVKAMKKLESKEGSASYNLGTGVGYSVLDVLHAYEKACHKTLKYEIQPRRAGDIATCYSDCTKAKEELGWVAEKGIEEMCADSWRWQSIESGRLQRIKYRSHISRSGQSSNGWYGS